jgi:hypothetical protein
MAQTVVILTLSVSKEKNPCICVFALALAPHQLRNSVGPTIHLLIHNPSATHPPKKPVKPPTNETPRQSSRFALRSSYLESFILEIVEKIINTRGTNGRPKHAGTSIPFAMTNLPVTHLFARIWRGHFRMSMQTSSLARVTR